MMTFPCGRKQLRGVRHGVAAAAMCLVVVLAACTAWAGAAPPPSAAPPAWRPLFRGIEHAEVTVAQPRPLRIIALRIRLAEPGISFLVTPSNGERPLETDGMRTSTFLRKHACQVAVNGSPYRPLVTVEGASQDVLGVSMSRGDAYSEGVAAYGALLICKENKAWIAAPPVSIEGAYNGVGGFHLLLKDGENVGAEDTRHPRTAAGVSRDGRYLYLLCIDGRQAGYSEGASTAETAEWMRWAGAHDALNLDGGGSTTMAAADGTGGTRLLNRPIHAGIPGRERIVANHLGVFARPLGNGD